MIGLLLVTAFAAQPVPTSDNPAVDPPTHTLQIDILLKPTAEKCEVQNGEEIVVCAKQTDNESQRLRPIANTQIYGKDDSRADFGISGNVRMAAEVESKELGGGVTSKSIMARVKIKF